MRTIDLNADLGENTPERIVADDEAMLGIVSSANVSCGFHAGDPDGIRATLAAAVARGVRIGAHPGYRDLEGFGRHDREVPAAILQSEVEYQLGALLGLSSAVGGAVRYVKPHGALYNRIAWDETQARAVVAAVRAIDPSLVVLGLPGSAVLALAEGAGLPTAAEAFADRAYAPDGALVSRREAGAVLHDPVTVAARMLRLAHEGVIEAIDGSLVPVHAESICVHGDSAGAVVLARAVRNQLEAEGIRISPFAGAL
ncbi:LamB/YcsF family protein [Microbacterium stercoris]|uniref:5-oxoprolinase subunit A n=1 Tax=Microbacterium stercoris TaxID=2820289 RepID=A0A939QKJ1_9MICO|nr:5-oxoprolinase subunit PxpA [Microbacterium stercoris]MBO3662412.1 LamB/YcsF family protein [Microbacterium stercoris]MBO3664404.1 LamB/YcsF family protein [Microbacterium stercoris]